MKVLVAGATGVIGRPLLPLLESAGHEVIGLARARRRGTTAPILAVDALDREATTAALRDIAPDAVVNMLTAIPATLRPRRMTAEFALTNRLRTEGTQNLLDAACAVGVRRIVSQGLAYAYDPGDGLADEDVPLMRRPPAQFASSVAALRELETATTEAGGTVLRMGHLYAPGTMFAADGSITADIRAGKLPLVGHGASVFSFVHVDDVATAVLAALGRDVPGVLNIVDDDPSAVSEWLPIVADVLEAPPPRRLPVFLARLAAGGWGATYLTALRGADNTRARTTLDWQPTYRSWRTGLAQSLRQKPSDKSPHHVINPGEGIRHE
jgi:nucleoside-diphosphate-sugar epimerase